MNTLEGSERKWNSYLKRFVLTATVLIGIVLIATLMVSQFFVAISSGLLSRVIHEQFAATFCVPIAYLSALMLVLVLRISGGPIEFKFWGFEFKGASGPLVFWIACFLAIVWAFKVMWIWKN